LGDCEKFHKRFSEQFHFLKSLQTPACFRADPTYAKTPRDRNLEPASGLGYHLFNLRENFFGP
jgi:hypothetical protein